MEAHTRRTGEAVSTHLDLDDVCAGHPLAQRELAALRAEVAGLRNFVEHVRRNGSTHLAGMAIAVLAALEQKP